MLCQSAGDFYQFRVQHRFATADGDDLRSDLIELVGNDRGFGCGQAPFVAIFLFPEIADAAAEVAVIENLEVHMHHAPCEEIPCEPQFFSGGVSNQGKHD